MAINQLTGIDWGINGNWSTGTKPADGGDVALTELIPGKVTGGLVQDGVYLDSLYVAPSCIKPIGDVSGPLTLSTLILVVEGQAGFHMAGEATTPGNDIIDCRIDCANANVPVSLTSEGGNPANWDQIIVNRGTVSIGAALLFDACRLEVGYHNKSTAANDATVNIASSADTLPTIVQVGGTIKCEVLVTTATCMGGKYTQKDKAVTTCTVGAGGKFFYQNGTASTITTLRILPGGTADFTQAFGETTITTLWLHPGGTIIGADQGGNSPIEGSVIIGTKHDLGGWWRRSSFA